MPRIRSPLVIRRPTPSALPLRTLALTLAVLVLAAFAVLAVARPAGACGCGIAYGTTVGTERAVVSLQDGREEIVLGLDLQRPGQGSRSRRRPAVLLPVPATPTVTALTGRAATIFNELELATRPVVTASNGDDGSAGAPAATGDVSVLSRERIGDYDVTRLRAGDAADLRRWLNRGGYATPAAAEPILRDYVRRGWAFVAIRLDDAVADDQQTLSPLRISFAAERLVYPLRLSSTSKEPVDVELYVAGPNRVVATGFDTSFAGFASGLRPALSTEVLPLVRGRYLTKLGLASDDPKAITSDVFVRQATSDRLFRASTGYPYETEENFARGPLPSELVTARSAAAENTLEDPPGGALWLVLFPAIGFVVLLVFAFLRVRERFINRT